MGPFLHDFQRWQPRAQAAVLKAEATIEERRDLDNRDNHQVDSTDPCAAVASMTR
jgi:hypothetical protein